MTLRPPVFLSPRDNEIRIGTYQFNNLNTFMEMVGV